MSLTATYLIILVTAVAMLVSLLSPSRWLSEACNISAGLIDLGLSIDVVATSYGHSRVAFHSLILVDSLDAWIMLCISIVFLGASTYSRGYMRREAPDRTLRGYHGLFAGFALIMYLSAIQNNPGLYWIAIDLSTLASALLIGYQRHSRGIEAAWKYLVIVSAGLSLALIGTVLFYYAGTFVYGSVYSMTWKSFAGMANRADPGLLLVAFLLVLIGYGTKAGLAPMHTWLPDAHSEGPTPVSAMLSGALLNCAMMGIVRYLAVVRDTQIYRISATSLVALGALSLIIAALFITRQNNVKRLAAYSSIEHMGIIAMGFGFGGPLGVLGALYQIINHSLAKCAVFFGAGNVIANSGSGKISKIRRVLDDYPVMGGLWLLAAVAITGAPPFGLFLSELTIFRAGIASFNPWADAVLGVSLIVIFAGFMNQFRRMYFGPHNPGRGDRQRLQLTATSVVPLGVAVALVLVLGLWWPHSLWIYFQHIATSLKGA